MLYQKIIINFNFIHKKFHIYGIFFKDFLRVGFLRKSNTKITLIFHIRRIEKIYILRIKIKH